MVLNHLWGLYTHPKQEWRTIERSHENIFSSISHVLIMAAIPAICGYVATSAIGWNIGAEETIKLTASSAGMIAIAMYFGLIIGVGLLAYLIHWMAGTFGSKPEPSQALEIAAYTSTPLFMVGFSALYPQLWFISCVGLAGVTYSVYLLYTGVPIVMRIPEERGFIYASSVVTCALVLLVALMAGSVILWGFGMGPSFTS